MHFGSLFRKKRRTLALIDIGSASVGGAYAAFADDDMPVILYTAREEIRMREDSLLLSDLERALSDLLGRLTREGAAALARGTGSGAVDDILVSVAAPWEKTDIDVRIVERKSAFTFSHALISETFGKEEARLEPGRVLTDHAVIATLLNGYETNEPFGKRATRAELVVLTTTLLEQAALAIKGAIARAYNRKSMRVVGFPFVAYTVFRDVYPHERDYLIVDVTGEATAVSLVKRGILVDVATCSCGLNDLLRLAHAHAGAGEAGALPDMRRLADDAVATRVDDTRLGEARETWRTRFRETLADFASRFPLPRVVFLLSDADVRPFMQRLIVETPLPELRLSDEPFSVIPVAPEQLAPYIHTRGEAHADEFLSMLALFANKSTEQVSVR
ncbi:MAG: hypothetical protein KGI41_02985 [Patescibacteria group bacterium]|nr:hypothetical protein [Patescibacteria group bacterium]MDE1966179.1 hypothetical protein [Patescibacteria group bacterium]